MYVMFLLMKGIHDYAFVAGTCFIYVYIYVCLRIVYNVLFQFAHLTYHLLAAPLVFAMEPIVRFFHKHSARKLERKCFSDKNAKSQKCHILWHQDRKQYGYSKSVKLISLYHK